MNMRIVFMGTPEFAIPSLKILLDNAYTIVGVVTAPDKPSGRGRQVVPSPVKVFAEQRHLTIFQPEKLTTPEFIQQLTSLQPDLIVVVAFRILPPAVYTIAKQGAFNLHGSLLPKYRGAAPINWAIINGERETGVTSFFLQEKVDTGNILLQARIPIGGEDTAGIIHDKLAEVGAEIVLHTVRLIEQGKTAPKPQDNTMATPAPKIFKENCRINWNAGSSDIHNFIRGLSPRPCAFTLHADTIIKIYRSKIVNDMKSKTPGEILRADGDIIVSGAEGAVQILELQQEGKKMLPAQEFLRGYRLSAGEMFTS
jgi:methionyl-tRNA formyltransferase